jgi:glyoxylase-like metal-dependent hydrolase (beta-lactamase superfamily II)
MTHENECLSVDYVGLGFSPGVRAESPDPRNAIFGTGNRMMQEQELSALGIFRIPIPIPFRQAGGPANAYVVEEDCGILLFDAGIGTEQSRAAFAEGLARTGHRFEEVNRILLSHGHVDHFGAAVWVQEQIGRSVPISIHGADANKVLESGADLPALILRNSRYLSRLGVPPPLLEETVRIIGKSAGLGRRLSEVTPLLPGDVFPCRHVTLEVHHMPGHTPGLCCLYERDHRLLFSADHLLEHVSPNPLMELSPEGEPTPFKPLVSYFESLDRVRALAVDLVLPGHAAPFRTCTQVIDSLAAFYQRRQEKLLNALERGPLTVYDAMRELFPSDSGFELILMISETLGNLELLEDKGRIERETDGEFIRFRLAS